jgi:hypothetical protein
MASSVPTGDAGGSSNDESLRSLVANLQQRQVELEERLKELERHTDEAKHTTSSDDTPSKTEDLSDLIGAIDQGTTSSRFLVFNRKGEPIALHQEEFKQIYPNPG